MEKKREPTRLKVNSSPLPLEVQSLTMVCKQAILSGFRPAERNVLTFSLNLNHILAGKAGFKRLKVQILLISQFFGLLGAIRGL